MALEYFTTSDQLTNNGLKFLVYGGSGVGKTVLTRTLPGETLIIGPEKGELSLAPDNQMRIFGDVRVMPGVRIKDATGLREAYELVSGPHGARFANVSLDSVSDIAEQILGHYLATQKDPRKAYGLMQETMAKYIRLFRDLPGKNVYFTAKLDKTQDETGAVMFGPSMPGKTMTQDLPYYFDEVFALVITGKDAAGKPIRKLRTSSDHQFSAKDRSGALAELEEPNLGAILAKIKQPNK